MKRSTELYKTLDGVKSEMKKLRDQGKVNEAHAKIQEIKNLEIQIAEVEAEERAEVENFAGDPVIGAGSKQDTENIKDMGDVKVMSGKLFKNAIMPHERMADKVENKNNKDVKLDKLMKGVLTGDWSNAAAEREYLNVIEATGDGKVLIPQHLSASIIDIARSKSAVFGKVPLINMKNGNEMIAKITKDPTAHFVAEGETIPTSDVTFDGVKLQSKTLAMLVPVSEILLKKGENVEEAIRLAMGGAIAEAMDKAILSGAGDGTAEAKEPKGILTYAGINKATYSDSVKYTDIVQGVKPIAKANLTATDAVMPTDQHLDLLSSTNAQGDFLNPPKALEDVLIDGSNNVTDTEAVVFDRNAVVVGISPVLTFDRGYTTDQFAKLQKSFRLYVGVDVVLVNEKGVSHLTKALVRSK